MTVLGLASLDARRQGRTDWALVLLAAAGLVMGALFAGFTVLYVNVPKGYNVIFGLSLDSAPLFRSVYRYPTISVDAHSFSVFAGGTLLLLWVVYLSASLVLGAGQITATRSSAVAVIAGFAVLFDVGLALAMPPVLSADVYHYALFGRMVALYHLNPYVTSDLAIKSDPLWQFAFWKDVTTHYGPVWTLVSAGLAWLTAQSVMSTVLAFKGVAAAFNLANCVLVFLLARRLGSGDGARSLLLYAWNPLVLIETTGSGHNEAAMMTFALLGTLLLIRGRVALGAIALTLSILVTYLTALLAFFVATSVVAASKTRRQGVATATRMVVVGGLVAAALYVPFWAGLTTFDRLVSVGSPFKTPVRVGLRELVARLIVGSGSLDTARAAAEPLVVAGLHVVFLLLVLFLTRRLIVERPTTSLLRWSRVLEQWGIASLVYVTLIYGWDLPFYLILPMATVFVGPFSRTNDRLNAACTGLGIAMMLEYVILRPV
ncbi:MAG TPA: hypothetical protein VNL16_02085 [Chloroflexota bacterium]|nr:hypothetical protein [Chloroflexota bacterium]